MKKLVILALLVVSFVANAQSEKNTEIKLDVFDILALKALDVSYEYIMNSESSVGVSVLLNFEKKSSSFRYNENFALTPYYRQQLFEKGNVKFFGELFGSLNSGDIKLEDIVPGSNDDTYTDFAFGLGFGGKYVSNKGFVVDFVGGLGRNLFNTDVSRNVVPRVGISVGKQF